ncbi:MAG: phage holin family protein [Candidatus Nomurabacteria bacterium]|nr:phage holin family protein [Candidatus Nomurabacteria bacterium]
MLKTIIKFLILAGVIMALPYLITGITVTTTTVALIATAVISLSNTFVKPILKALTLPFNIISLGLFGVVLNIILFWIASLIVPGFTIATFSAGVIGSIIISAISWILHRTIK